VRDICRMMGEALLRRSIEPTGGVDDHVDDREREAPRDMASPP
jgi:hypothetical protein